MSTVPNYADWREARRFRALDFSRQGWSLTRIAHALGVSVSAVSQWRKTMRQHGEEALQTQAIPGRPPRLNAAQRAELVTLLKDGAEAQGFEGDVWTSPRVSVLIAQHGGITLQERQVRRLLHQVGWSRQMPERRAEPRDEAAIAQWARERWPALKKRPPGAAPDPVYR